MNNFLSNIKSKLSRDAVNALGWKTKRKIVVFESDDWGTIRMASKQAYERLLKKGYPVDKCAYNQNDALESNEDLQKLGEILLEFKDLNGNPAKFTIDNVVANPDFEKIKQHDYQKYFYEPFTTTSKRYKNSDQVVNLYKKGIKEGIFQPQFHGREHVNVNRWLTALQNNDKHFRDAFEENMFSNAITKMPVGRRGYLDSFGENYTNEYEDYHTIIKEGASLFEKLWGFKSDTFIAPCYVWPSYIEPTLKEVGVRGIQGTHIQRIPLKGKGYKIEKKFHYTGQKNKLEQYYLVRNVFFEPTENGKNNAVENAMRQIDRSFKYNTPAIISSHRVNYIGSIRSENRDENLKLLSIFLKHILAKYPDVEFLSSDELLELMDYNS